ncbi:MAG: 50S ribosomal protein L22 [Pyrinomonadaceae bacterium]
MEAIAKTRHLKGSPRKTRLVIDLIRGENVSRALAILKFTDKRAAGPIEKTLRSAIANATYLAEQQNIAVDPDDLWVRTCFVDMGAHKNRRRMRPAPQGRAYRETRHYCHITIAVTSDDKPKTEKELKVEAAKARAADRPKKEKTPVKKAAPRKAKAEEIETPIVDTPVAEAVETVAAENAAEVADVKDASTTAEAESNETKPADDRQQDINEDLERQ